ncbi:gamma-glutamyl-gamma-aminobutyrate hydrolase [Maritimibacter sp. 55A14]|uniref:gamma-glutamyl-gamma-aminobutyrate hydrolase family protein n=1 Tax=Maritimibacter sp. 55A14 TaxID=2174844 RepID=UPI000D61A229|nr:gamma-glutamyl-gamma-aminobutyrate hydrolase family protein [Maritimibacter sp. 55A14]PWE34034.1 gamma-glutamyl-gamma-aminobutyrate hydrolase [Maritimibacter sp. 55A14]
MTRPVVAILGNSYLIDDRYWTHGGGMLNSAAVAEVSGALPVIVPTDPRFVSVADLLERFDGFVLPGGRPNVHPEEYGQEPTDAHGAFDRARDTIALGLVRACVERGQPFLGICRGFQEVNVAMGGTLHPEIRELPGRMNHRMPPDGTVEEQFALRHNIRLEPGGVFSRVFGADEVMVNSLHGQGIEMPGPRVVIEGFAPDGTPEALHVRDAPGFTLSVQWHPEWNAANDPVSRPLFEAFGAAVHRWSRGERMARAV